MHLASDSALPPEQEGADLDVIVAARRTLVRVAGLIGVGGAFPLALGWAHAPASWTALAGVAALAVAMAAGVVGWKAQRRCARVVAMMTDEDQAVLPYARWVVRTAASEEDLAVTLERWDPVPDPDGKTWRWQVHQEREERFSRGREALGLRVAAAWQAEALRSQRAARDAFLLSGA